MNFPRIKLKEQGYCVFRNVLSDQDISPIRSISDRAIKNVSENHLKKNKSQGSLLLIADYPEFSPLIGHRRLKVIFSKLGFLDPRFSSGYIISKPPKSPALFWHQDWWGWDHPISYTNEIAQVFIMIYLQNTNIGNGCLRVIPESHITPHELHSIPEAHTESLSKVENPKNPLYKSIPEECPVPVNVGDVIVGDARLLHGSFPNQSQEERTLITLWFHPHFKRLPEAMKARICQIFQRKGVDTDPLGKDSLTLLKWPITSRQSIQQLFPQCKTEATPQPWSRLPTWN